MNNMKVQLLMTTWNNIESTKRAVHSVYKNTTVPFDLIVIDNMSDDGTLEYLEGLLGEKDNFTYRRFLCSRATAENTGFSMAIDRRAEFVVILSNDIYCYPNWLKELLDVMENDPRIGMCGPVHSTALPLQDRPFGDFKEDETPEIKWDTDIIAVKFLQWNCCLLRIKMIEDVGFVRNWLEDGEYEFRALRRGWHLRIVPTSLVYHWYGTTSYNRPDGVTDQHFMERGQRLWRKLYTRSEIFLWVVYYEIFPLGYEINPEEMRRKDLDRLIGPFLRLTSEQ